MGRATKQGIVMGVFLFALGVVVGFFGDVATVAARRPMQRERPVSPSTAASTRAAPPTPSAGIDPGSASELAAVLAELRDALSSLEATLARGQVPSSRRVASGDAPNGGGRDARVDAQLAASLNALAAALRGQPGSSASFGGGAPRLVAPEWVDRGTVFNSVAMRDAIRSDDEAAWDRANADWQQRHLFWTVQELLDAYGKPDQIEVDEGRASWYYAVERGEREEEQFYFEIQGGVVFRASYEFDY